MGNVAKFSETQSYADDTQIIYRFDPLEYNDVVANVESDLQKILTYCRSHNLKLNAKKTQVLLFAPARSDEFLKDYLDLQMDGQSLNFVDTARNLGVLFDARLRFGQHISNLSKLAYLKLKILYSNKYILNFKVRKKLCEAYILSTLSYCLVLYYPCLTQKDRQRLQVIQNNCCRFIFGIRKYDHVNEKIAQLNWLKISNVFRYLLLTFVYKLLKSSTPMYLRSKLIFRSQIHNMPVRSDYLTMPQHKTVFFSRSFTYNAVNIFNNFYTLFDSGSLAIFRRNIKTVIFNEQLM